MDQNIDTPKSFVYCQLHDKLLIKQICTNLQCTAYPYVCSDEMCKYNINFTHQGHINQVLNLEEFFQGFSHQIEKNLKIVSEIDQQLLRENGNIINYINNVTNHFEKIEKHISAQKYVIQQRIQDIQDSVYNSLKTIENNLYSQLDVFLQKYKFSFQNFQKFYQQSFKLNKRFKYYQNANNLSAKLSSVDAKNSSLLFNEIKQSLHQTQLIAQNPQNFLVDCQSYINELNVNLDNLPYYQEQEDLKTIILNLENFLLNSLQMPQKKSLIQQRNFYNKTEQKISPGLNISSSNATSLIMNSKVDYRLKLKTKLQIDQQMNCILNLTQNLLILGCTDGQLKILNLQTKQINFDPNLPSHFKEIILLQDLQNFQFCSSGEDKQVMIWALNDQGNIQLVNKIGGFNSYVIKVTKIADNIMVTGSMNGDIEIWDYQLNVRLQHLQISSGVISDFLLLRSYDQFFVSTKGKDIVRFNLDGLELKYNELITLNHVDEISFMYNINDSQLESKVVVIQDQKNAVFVFNMIENQLLCSFQDSELLGNSIQLLQICNRNQLTFLLINTQSKFVSQLLFSQENNNQYNIIKLQKFKMLNLPLQPIFLDKMSYSYKEQFQFYHQNDENIQYLLALNETKQEIAKFEIMFK